MIALIGIGGRIKGLPLIYAANDEDFMKKCYIKYKQYGITICNLDIGIELENKK